ncbi:hypothetical protein C8Q80DRAFT_752880 [Daedaleopsis nitida]|nr:hypothetical protein C8Q80DRAFT_752880 [Daedaleopsis nitida]
MCVFQSSNLPPVYTSATHLLLRCTDGEGGAGEGPSAAPVRARDGQYPGQGPGALEAQVCLLDPGSPRRGTGGSEGPLGRADGQRGVGRVGGNTMDPARAVEVGLGYLMPGTSHYSIPHSPPLYHRAHEDVLGEDPEDMCGGGERAAAVRRCFNCGSTEHAVSDCPEPFDRALVALSRQLFQFYHGESSGPFHRLYEVEEWRAKRLKWIGAFAPGEIRGPVLRDALGLEDGDVGEDAPWLRNIACWGYPPGWVGAYDPRERVRERIARAGEDDAEEVEFAIYDDGDPERCVLTGFSGVQMHDSDDDYVENDEDGEECGDTSLAAPVLKRWARYPDTHFLYSKLPVYTGFTLPPLGSDERRHPLVSSTYTIDRQTLWQKITSSVDAPASRVDSVPPWRQPALSVHEPHLATWACNPPPPSSTPPPPPPPSTPPPLPPPSPSTPPPPPSICAPPAMPFERSGSPPLLYTNFSTAPSDRPIEVFDAVEVSGDHDMDLSD